MTLRPNYEDLPVAEWTDAEAYDHLSGTFDHACRAWPDIMERWMILLADALPQDRKELMRAALRETINERGKSAYDRWK